MMAHLEFFKWLSLLLFAIKGLQAHEIVIDKELRTYVIQEGDELIIKCRNSVDSLQLMYPQDDVKNGIYTSRHEISFEKQLASKVNWTFRRERTIFGDTGWYACLDFYGDPKIKLTPEKNAAYIYVNCKANWFVSKIQNATLLVAPTDETLIVPCRPTSPHFKVDLFIGAKNSRILPNDNVVFDPRIGYKIKGFTSSLGNSLMCRIIESYVVAEMWYQVRFLNQDPLQNLKISFLGNSEVATVNKIFIMTCSFSLSVDVNVQYVEWITPRNKDDRITYRHPYNKLKINQTTVQVSLDLIVKNVNYNDMGLYICKLSNSIDKYAVSRFIKIKDYKEIRVPTGPIITQGDEVKLECIRYNGLTETLGWTNTKNELIKNDKSMSVLYVNHNRTYIKSTKRAILTIKNITKADEGVYTCLIKNSNGSFETLSYNITTHEPEFPVIFQTNVAGNKIFRLGEHPDEQSKTLFCFATGYPEPIIHWYKDNTLITKETSSRSNYLFPGQHFLLEIPADVTSTGFYKCMAANRMGNAAVYTFIQVKEEHYWVSAAVILVFFTFVMVIGTRYYRLIIAEERRKRELRILGLETFFEGNPTENLPENIPYKTRLEIEKSDFQIERKIGTGEFGFLVSGKARVNGRLTRVAIKVVKSTAHPAYIRAIAKELKILSNIGVDVNITNILGACTEDLQKGKLMLFVELCPFGNIRDFLIKRRATFVNQIDPNTGFIIIPASEYEEDSNATDFDVQSNVLGPFEPTVEVDAAYDSSTPGWRSNCRPLYDLEPHYPAVATRDLMYWNFQISSGLEFLHRYKIVHGDLSAKNIWLGENEVVKICDIYLAKSITDETEFRDKFSPMLPVKWMSPEAIVSQRFTKMSDIWAFGVLSWEIFTLAEEPYQGIEVDSLLQRLIDGYRLRQPKYAIEPVYNIMRDCWQIDVNLRPAASTILRKAENLLEDCMKSRHYEESTTTRRLYRARSQVPFQPV